jgi:hypothetical protein
MRQCHGAAPHIDCIPINCLCLLAQQLVCAKQNTRERAVTTETGEHNQGGIRNPSQYEQTVNFHRVVTPRLLSEATGIACAAAGSSTCTACLEGGRPPSSMHAPLSKRHACLFKCQHTSGNRFPRPSPAQLLSAQPQHALPVDAGLWQRPKTVMPSYPEQRTLPYHQHTKMLLFSTQPLPQITNCRAHYQSLADIFCRVS